MHRENKKMKRALSEAKLRLAQACIEDVDYSARREIDKSVVRQLASCRWVEEHQAVLITGMTGTGKSYLACALAHQACRKGFRAVYRRASRLFDELKLARADGTYARVLARLARIDVTSAPLDEVALRPQPDNMDSVPFWVQFVVLMLCSVSVCSTRSRWTRNRIEWCADRCLC